MIAGVIGSVCRCYLRRFACASLAVGFAGMAWSTSVFNVFGEPALAKTIGTDEDDEPSFPSRCGCCSKAVALMEVRTSTS